MQSGRKVVRFPPERMLEQERQRDRKLARLMLKRLDFERRLLAVEMTDVEKIAEDAGLTAELFMVAEELGL